MRLTNYLRDAFVSAVMQDVPSVEYDQLIRDEMMTQAVNALPPLVQDTWKTHPDYINQEYVYVGNTSVRVPFNRENNRRDRENLPKSVQALVKKQEEQQETHGELRRKLRAVAYGVTTVKALREQLPEFEKYLPTEEGKPSTTLPAIANLVSDLTKAGWPAGGKNAQASK